MSEFVVGMLALILIAIVVLIVFALVYEHGKTISAALATVFWLALIIVIANGLGGVILGAINGT